MPSRFHVTFPYFPVGRPVRELNLFGQREVLSQGFGTWIRSKCGSRLAWDRYLVSFPETSQRVRSLLGPADPLPGTEGASVREEELCGLVLVGTEIFHGKMRSLDLMAAVLGIALATLRVGSHSPPRQIYETRQI